MRFHLWFFALLVLLGTPAAPLFAQADEEAAPPLKFEGDPMVLPLECWEEDLLRGGLVCNDVTPCTLVMELVAIGNLGDTVFVMGNVHADAGTVSSVILSSADGGKTWIEPLGRIPGGSLELFRTVDAEHGWIGGQQWEADSSPIPFIISTRNGGGRWTDRYIWEEDDRNGMVIELDFEDPRHGYLIIERTNAAVDPFELYETMTGGSSWSFRAATEDEPEIPFDPVQPEDRWRLRSEDSSYWVERKNGGAWTPAAAFASHVGTCNNMERKGEAQPAFE